MGKLTVIKRIWFMFNGNLVIKLMNERNVHVGEFMKFVFGRKSHTPSTWFKDRVFIDTRYLERLSEYFSIPISDFFLTDEEYKEKQENGGKGVHHISNSVVNVNSSPDVMLGIINNQRINLEQNAQEIAWLRNQVETLQETIKALSSKK